jgi:hypothetical protein
MQFGKFHGWAFIALGVLLIFVQAVIWLPVLLSVQDPNRPGASPPVTTPLPCIVGGLSLIFGVALYLANRNKPQE